MGLGLLTDELDNVTLGMADEAIIGYEYVAVENIANYELDEETEQY